MIRWLFLLLGDFESGLERLLIFSSALLFVLLHFLFCAEDAVYIGTHGLEFFVIILEITVSIVLGVLLNRKLLFFCPEVFHGRKLPIRRVLLQNLKGKVRCGNCRRAMGYDYKQASPIFWCREGQELIGQTKCSSEIFQANDIENAVFQALKKELSLLGSLYGDIKKEEQSLKEASRKASRRKTSMEQELKNLKGEKMRMYEEYAAGTLSLDNYKNKKQEYDRKIAEVQDKIEQSKAEEAAQSVVPGTVRAAAEQAENFLHGTRLTASMVSAFIENVYVHEGGRIVVQFKYEQSIQDAVRALHTD